MKQKELDVLKRISQHSTTPVKPSEFEYNRFDALNEKTIFEIKCRDSYYNYTMIEFDKFSYNYVYSKVNNLNFIYAVEMEGKIYLFDILKLVRAKYDFNWQWKELSKTTEFTNNDKVKKYIGFINVNESIYVIE